MEVKKKVVGRPKKGKGEVKVEVKGAHTKSTSNRMKNKVSPDENRRNRKIKKLTTTWIEKAIPEVGLEIENKEGVRRSLRVRDRAAIT